MTANIDRRIEALEKVSGSTAERPFVVITFHDGSGDMKTVVGLDPLSGAKGPSFDRLPGESYEDLQQHAKAGTEHLPVAVYIVRTGI